MLRSVIGTKGNVHYGYEKDVMLTFYCNGHKVQRMVTGILCEDGKTRVPLSTYNAVLSRVNAERGQTYSH